MSEVIEECYEIQSSGDEKQAQKAEKLIDSAIETFDQLITKLHQGEGQNAKSHFRALRTELAESTANFFKEIEKLKP